MTMVFRVKDDAMLDKVKAGDKVQFSADDLDARKHGETEARLHLLSAWRESMLYADRERAALGWTEALTRVSETRVPDDVYEALRQHFNEDEHR
jgi:alkylhydroperoxidase family enzyme